MDHLPDGPSASAIRRIELGFFQTLHRRPDFGGQRPNLIHGLLPPRRRDLGGHLEIPNRVARIHREHLLEQRRFWEYTHAHSDGSMRIASGSSPNWPPPKSRPRKRECYNTSAVSCGCSAE